MKERAGEEDLDSGPSHPRLSNIARCLACLTLLPRQSKEPTREPNKTSLGPSRSMKHQTNGAECSNNPRRQFGGYDGNGYHTVIGNDDSPRETGSKIANLILRLLYVNLPTIL